MARKTKNIYEKQYNTRNLIARLKKITNDSYRKKKHPWGIKGR